MAKLPRKTQKIFCSNPTSKKQTSVFGTMKTADKQYSTDVGTLQSNAAYEQGWKSATIASYKPFMEDFNTLNYINTSQLAYLFQQGIPEWDSATTYYKNSFCSYNGDLWKSLIDDNLNNTPLEGEAWTLFTSSSKSGGGLELCDIGTALYVDETQGKRRILNGSIVDINANTQAWLNRLLEIYAAAPDYFTDEATWQSEATLNVDGCVYKFVLNYDSTGTNVVSVRLPKYPDYVEIDSLSSSNAVVGNGMALGLDNGTNKCGMYIQHDYTGGFHIYTAQAYTGIYGNPIGGISSLGSHITSPLALGVTDDPEKSGLVVDGSGNQQTKLKLRYFTQIATGQETENNIVNDIELNNPYVLFKSEYFEAPPYNISWLKSDGEYKPKATYPKAYEALVVENNSSIAVGTTVNLPSGTKYTKRGLSVKLSTASDITDYDFVINTTNETFRLPLKNGMEGVFASGVKGNGLTMGLTNGTYNLGIGSGQNNVAEFLTSFYGQNIPYTYTSGATPVPLNTAFGLTTDPTKSGIVVDTTVPSGYNLYYYVGETVQNANIINAGRIAEELGNKISKNACKAYVVKTYSNGSSWYRLWSDNWLEQGGIFNGASSNLVYLKEFGTVNYNIIVAPSVITTSDTKHTLCRNKTTTGCELLTCEYGHNGATDANYNHNWYASGYAKG